MDGIECPKIEVEEAEVCEGMVTAEEAGRALDSMKNGSAPGGDGLTIEFFKFFWLRLKQLVTDSFNEAFTSEEMTYTTTRDNCTITQRKISSSRQITGYWETQILGNRGMFLVLLTRTLVWCGADLCTEKHRLAFT